MRAKPAQVALVLLGILVSSTTAGAEELPPAKSRRVAVLRVRNYAPPADLLFASSETKEPTPEAEIAQVIEARLGAESDITQIGPEALDKRIQSLRIYGGVTMALATKSKAEEYYRDLNTDAAIPLLEQAEAALSASYYDIVKPKSFSNLALTQALAYVEQKDEVRIRDALKRLFWLDPKRAFTRGFYQETFETQITSAFTDFRATYPKENPLRTQQRLDQFLADIDVDSLVYAWIEADGQAGRGSALHVAIYDRTLATVLFKYPLRADSKAPRAHLDRLDRFLSSWLTCLPHSQAPESIAEPQRLRRFFIDTGFAYSVFTLNDATSEPFHNLGVAIYSEYQFLAGLGAYLRVDLFNSTLDHPDKQLLDNVTSARTSLGITYSFQGSWWRLAPHFGVEVQFLGTLKTAKDGWCKFQSLDSFRCQEGGGVDTDLSNVITVGPTVGLSTQFFASRHFYIGVRASISIFIAPFSDVDRLNIPFSSDVSLGYAY